MKKTITDRETKVVALDIINGGGGGGGGSTLKTFTFMGGSDPSQPLEVALPTDCNLILSISGQGVIEGIEYSISCSTLPATRGFFKTLIGAFSDGSFVDGIETNRQYYITNGKIHFEQVVDEGTPFSYPIPFTVFYI